jgi:hypothetical protein
LKTFNTPVKVKLFESPGKAGGLPILIMKYRILIRKIVNTNQEILNWYMETGNAPWETENEEIALTKYKELLQKYSIGDLNLISPITVDIAVTA